MKKFADWFTPERRQQIQTLIVTVVPLFLMFGYGTTGQWEQVQIITSAILAAAGSLLSLVHIRVTEWANEGWKIVRATIYTFGMTVSPALMLLGFYNEDVNTKIVTGVALGLTALSSAVAIFANGQQQKADVIAGRVDG